MTDVNGTTPKVLTTEQRNEAVVTFGRGVVQTEETKQLRAGASLFLAGDHYNKNRSNISSRAQSNGFRAHTRKAVVDGEDGYVVWWEPPAVPA